MLRGPAIKIQSLFMCARRLTSSFVHRELVCRVSLELTSPVSPTNTNLQQTMLNTMCLLLKRFHFAILDTLVIWTYILLK